MRKTCCSIVLATNGESSSDRAAARVSDVGGGLNKSSLSLPLLTLYTSGGPVVLFPFVGIDDAVGAGFFPGVVAAAAALAYETTAMATLVFVACEPCSRCRSLLGSNALV